MAPSAEMDRLAEDCVRAFEPLRAPLSEPEERRRMTPALTSRQRDLLKQWGYPYVLDQFRFHLSLTGRLSANARAVLLAALTEATRDLTGRPVPVRGIAIYRQPARSAPFRLIARIRWGGSLD